MKRFFIGLLLLCFSMASAPWVAAQQQCPGAPPPRLVVGQDGRVLPGDSNNLRDQPDRSGTRLGSIPGGASFRVLEGPTCANDLAWWRVDYNGLIGWTVEGSGSNYFVEPLTVTPTPVIRQPGVTATPQTSAECGQAPRLFVGQFAFINSATPSRLRDQPSTSGTQIGQVFNDQNFTVLDGPVCSAGFTWWQIDYKGSIGWTVESGSAGYFIEGVGATATPPPTQTPRPTLTPTITNTPRPTQTPSPTATATIPAYIGFNTPLSIAWMSDGSRIVIATIDGLYVFSVDDLAAPPTVIPINASNIVAHPSEASIIAMVTASTQNNRDGYRVTLYDIDTQEETLLIEESPVRGAGQLQFGANGQRVIFSVSGTLAGYDLAAETQYNTRSADLNDAFGHVAISGNGQRVAVFQSVLAVPSFGDFGSSHSQMAQLDTAPIVNGLGALVLNEEGTLLLAGDVRGNLRAWRLPEGTYSSFIRGERSPTSNFIGDIYITTDGRIFTAESGPQAVVRRFSFPGLIPVQAYNVPAQSGVRGFSFSPDESQLVVMMDDVAHVLDANTLELIAVLAPIRN